MSVDLQHLGLQVMDPEAAVNVVGGTPFWPAYLLSTSTGITVAVVGAVVVNVINHWGAFTSGFEDGWNSME
jgi:hypothetical protein